MGGYEEMLTSADKVGGSKKGQNHADVVLEWSLIHIWIFTLSGFSKRSKYTAQMK